MVQKTPSVGRKLVQQHANSAVHGNRQAPFYALAVRPRVPAYNLHLQYISGLPSDDESDDDFSGYVDTEDGIEDLPGKLRACK